MDLSVNDVNDGCLVTGTTEEIFRVPGTEESNPRPP